MMTSSLSLYLHIPFCRHRCSYCDFNTYTSLGDLQGRYAAALAAEIRQVAGAERRPAHTVFFGGGTPSLMAPADLERNLEAVGERFQVAAGAEITMEANPGTVDLAYLAAIRHLGVNRLSFGAQSAISTELALLGREHTFGAVVEAIELARRAGFNNLSVDLIYGLPGQTLASWEKSVRAALALETTHLSLYCLTIEPGTPMERWLHSGQIAAPDADLAADQYELACDLLSGEKSGLIHYEISNWARPGFACDHNLTYWRNGEYLGLGAGAHGHALGYRYQVVKQPRVYIRRLEDGPAGRYPWSAAVADRHVVSQAEAMADTVITQLRLLEEGLDLASFETTFGRSFDDVYGPTVEQLVEWGLLRQEGGRLLLTRQGRFLSNQVFYRFM
jgi:oxygen-independent coproporphyrinogen-3 oxidase